MKVAIGNDHTATDMKNEIKNHLAEKGLDVLDLGTNSKESCDYPLYAHKVASAVLAGEADCGVLICGTGSGMSMAANKIRGIRAVSCSEPYTAKLSKQHNNSNILTFGARVIGAELAKLIVDSWLEAEYEGGRHQIRVEMIDSL